MAACTLGLLGAWAWPRAARRAADPAAPLSRLGGEAFLLELPDIVRQGPRDLWVLRFVRPVELVPHHYAAAGLAAPLHIDAWAESLGAEVVFNAGQFDAGRQHLGWLKASDSWLSPRRKREWLALLVSGPHLPGPWGRVVDLGEEDGEVVARYRHAVQSMMLVDGRRRVRVRRSDRAACRTVVAEDRQGRLLVLATVGAVTLFDLAAWLPQAGLEVVRAMNLDGGGASQLRIDAPALQLTLVGRYGGDPRLGRGRRVLRAPLPAVVAVYPQGAAPAAAGAPDPPQDLGAHSPAAR